MFLTLLCFSNLLLWSNIFQFNHWLFVTSTSGEEGARILMITYPTPNFSCVAGRTSPILSFPCPECLIVMLSRPGVVVSKQGQFQNKATSNHGF